MPENAPDPGDEKDLDPGASTQMFQAYAERYGSKDSQPPRTRPGLMIAALVALVIVVVLVWLVVRG